MLSNYNRLGALNERVPRIIVVTFIDECLTKIITEITSKFINIVPNMNRVYM